MGIEQIRAMKDAAKIPKPLKKYQIPKVSKKRAEQIAAEKEARGGNDTELQRWFKQKIKISSGFCSECGCNVEKNVFKYAVMTVAHILPKRDTCCPSVKTHPLNFVILCPYHHDQFDKASWGEKEKMGCWNTVRDRLIMVYPDLDPSEHRHFPESVLRYMEKHNPFPA